MRPNIFMLSLNAIKIGGEELKKVLRNEKKFLLDPVEASNISSCISKILMKDPHNDASGYIVRSLYFDTVYNSDFMNKEFGLEKRKKIRLRLYDPKLDYAFLEMKQKDGSLQYKRSLKVNKQDALELIKGNYSVLLTYDQPFATELFSVMNMEMYRPAAVVQYNRKAYIAKENNIRITFDSNIIANESNFNIFDEKLLLYPVFDKYNTVLEVKYNGFLLSYIKDIIRDANKSEVSVSKYSLSRTIGMHFNF